MEILSSKQHSSASITMIYFEYTLIFTAKEPQEYLVEPQEIDFDDDISEPEPRPPKKRTVPTVIRWENGGQQVLLSGSFNDWKAKIPMNYR